MCSVFSLIFQYGNVYGHTNPSMSSNPCVTDITKTKGLDLLRAFINGGNSVQVSEAKVARGHGAVRDVACHQ